jgi:hypothetical protein
MRNLERIVIMRSLCNANNLPRLALPK